MTAEGDTVTRTTDSRGRIYLGTDLDDVEVTVTIEEIHQDDDEPEQFFRCDMCETVLRGAEKPAECPECGTKASISIEDLGEPVDVAGGEQA